MRYPNILWDSKMSRYVFPIRVIMVLARTKNLDREFGSEKCKTINNKVSVLISSYLGQFNVAIVEKW